MATRVALHHVTRYLYDRDVTLSPQVVRLRPSPHCRTSIVSYALKVTPGQHFINWQQDPFGNYLARLVFDKPTRELAIEVDLVADLVTQNPFDFFLEPAVEKFPFAYDAALARDLAPYLVVPETGARFSQLVGRIADDVARPGRRSVDVLVEINQLIQRALRYDIRMEPGVFAPDETLERGHGSCRDFAWLLTAVLRALGIAARFVSGYSIQLRPDVKSLDGPSGVEEDCTDLHAWAEAYLPGAGWVGFDATSGLACGEGHIPLACTADPSAASPVTGSFAWDKREEDDELGEKLDFAMRVVRLDDRPRPTRSYTDEQWRRVVACGEAVERALIDGDVRLTMGGEPTFVSADDMEAVEWNTAALGADKERLADQLVRRLRRRFAPAGLLHHGMGKWYPGESLPRWAYSLYWRKDGEPIWRDDRLVAAPPAQGGPMRAPRQNDGLDAAQALMNAMVRRLGIDPGHALPGYEDVWYYLWRERRLPANVVPLDARLDDEEERARLRRVFEHGLGKPVGWALPLRAEDATDGVRWVSGAWFLRDDRLYLLPGDSPMGLRLPLDSLPWADAADVAAEHERDPFAPRPPLPKTRTMRQTRPEAARVAGGASPSSAPTTATATPAPAVRRGESARGLVRTALCVEPRGGTLHVFLPPCEALEHYLDLVEKVEASAAELDVPVRIEGYQPPPDHRLHRIQVTPDPGVIEVNIHPAASWQELCDNTAALYEEARATRLSTDKFMLDGRHGGTGGGNHVVIGGATPDDSPLLRRPELLPSLLAFFLNHPSLSYLFSGQFIGPTSQAPRLDEARGDSLYELDTAFGALAEHRARFGDAPRWLVNRLFRHLLVDVTGNVHRTEMCIDKLFSPDGASGRQGLVELRAFEMPPDARMSLAQQLLVRALVAKLWRQPYTRAVVRWGTALVDRFMLPHFLWQDLGDVVAELGEAGFPIEKEWFVPHLEFRFPRYGEVAVDGVTLELRQAAEPWHVLGEEPGAGGTVRYVDSSVERMQVLVRGLVDGRHHIACNGRRVPLHPTGRSGEKVAGVRYKAWKPPSSLHPTLEVNAPLVFDIVDGWNERAIGGCTYHVAHPGGRAYDVYPKNGLEAESRRISRFWPFGHSMGRMSLPYEEPSLELPLTLDLRRPPK